MFLAALALALASTPMMAQAASLVADINTTPSDDVHGPSLSDLQSAGGKLYFTVGGDQGGYDLWVSDGTAAGTEALRSICSNPCSSGGLLGPLRNWMLLLVDGELWRTDGTRPGTISLGVSPYVGSGGLWQFTADRNALYFVSCALPSTDCELWRSDGTPAGTKAFVSLDGYPASLTLVGDRLYFVRANSGHLPELWVTDGTAEGTVELH